METKLKKYLVSIPKEKHRLFKKYCVDSEISLNTLFIVGAEHELSKNKTKEVTYHGR